MFSLICAWTNGYANNRRRRFETLSRSSWRHSNDTARIDCKLYISRYCGRLRACFAYYPHIPDVWRLDPRRGATHAPNHDGAPKDGPVHLHRSLYREMSESGMYDPGYPFDMKARLNIKTVFPGMGITMLKIMGILYCQDDIFIYGQDRIYILRRPPGLQE